MLCNRLTNTGFGITVNIPITDTMKVLKATYLYPVLTVPEMLIVKLSDKSCSDHWENAQRTIYTTSQTECLS